MTCTVYHDAAYWVVERWINVDQSSADVPTGPKELVVLGSTTSGPMRSERENTPLGTTLAGVEVMDVLWAEPKAEQQGNCPSAVYGMSWGQGSPVVVTDKDVINTVPLSPTR